MAELNGIQRVEDCEVEVEEIAQSPLKKAFGTYNFIRADLAEGLNYGVDKDLVNTLLDAVGKELGRELPHVEESPSAQAFTEMMYPLLKEVRA